jgi:nucleosome binding factor SPN SPT16 subunit
MFGGDKALTQAPASYLEPLKGGKVPIEILVRGKDAEENKKQFQTCLETLKNAGKKVAVLKKDSSTGGFADEWKAAFAAADIKEEDQVDLAPILSQAALSVKDEKELVGNHGDLSKESKLTSVAHHPRRLPCFKRPHDQLLC